MFIKVIKCIVTVLKLISKGSLHLGKIVEKVTMMKHKVLTKLLFKRFSAANALNLWNLILWGFLRCRHLIQER